MSRVNQTGEQSRSLPDELFQVARDFDACMFEFRQGVLVRANGHIPEYRQLSIASGNGG